MRTSIMVRTSAALLAIGLACAARAQDRDPSATSVGGGLRLAAGIDYRSVFAYFYFYPSAYAETDGAAFGAAVEAAWMIPLGDKLEVGAGLSLALGSGTVDFSTPGPTTTSESLFLAHVEAFGEAGFQVVQNVSILGRLGLGYTGVLHSSADESFTNVLLGLGAQFSVTQRVGLIAIYQFQLAGLGGTTDAGVTSASPSLDNHDNSAFLARLTYRM